MFKEFPHHIRVKGYKFFIWFFPLVLFLGLGIAFSFAYVLGVKITLRRFLFALITVLIFGVPATLKGLFRGLNNMAEKEAGENAATKG